MSLSEYKKKRNFRKTPEPKGVSAKNATSKSGARSSGKAAHSNHLSAAGPVLYEHPSISKNIKAIYETTHLKFVVQKHHASHLHYDFRLELDDVLVSWAVPKGPSLDPSVKRLAMKVEDHPLDYMLFEGTIPEGNYGAGEVIVWDIGIYHSIGTLDPEENKRQLRAGIEKGHVDFVLYGKKLKGLFSLIKIKRDEENSNTWLLTKGRDAYASTKDVTENVRSVISTRRLADEDLAVSRTSHKPLKLRKSPRRKPRRHIEEKPG
jgi:DNA ligase D-like protein (predicted 3'-phosphoesterase)